MSRYVNQCEFALSAVQYCEAAAQAGKKYCAEHVNLVTECLTPVAHRMFPLNASYVWPNKEVLLP